MMKIRTLNTEVMDNEIFLWYNMILGEYFVGSKEEYDETLFKYHIDQVNVLYTMDVNSYSICNKIKNSLNRARVLVG